MQTQFMYKLEKVTYANDENPVRFLKHFDRFESAWAWAETEIDARLVALHGYPPGSIYADPWYLHQLHDDGHLYTQPSFVVTRLRSKSIPE